MKYPKPIMRKSELIQMGFSKKELEDIWFLPGQKIAKKISNKRNSPIVYDTEALERYRKRGFET